MDISGIEKRLKKFLSAIKYFLLVLILISAPVMVSCNSDNPGNETSETKVGSPVDTPSVTPEEVNYKKIINLKYGDNERNDFDIYYFPDSMEKTPAIIYIHGGGFVRRDKNQLPIDMRDKALENNIAVITINYPYINMMPLRESIENIIRAVQYIKYVSEEYNIDKEKIACFGESAGAGASLLIAVTDDMAQPESEDPVLRESTRIFCAGLYRTQATYDSTRFAEVLGLENALVEAFLKQTGFFMDSLYGIEPSTPEEEQALSEERDFLHMIGKISEGDPPLYIWSDFPYFTPDFIHTPAHSVAIYNRCIEVGVYAEYYNNGINNVYRPLEKDFVDFFLERLEEG